MIMGQPRKLEGGERERKKETRREEGREREGGGGREGEMKEYGLLVGCMCTYQKGPLQTLLGYRVSFCIRSDSVSTAPPLGQLSVMK